MNINNFGQFIKHLLYEYKVKLDLDYASVHYSNVKQFVRYASSKVVCNNDRVEELEDIENQINQSNNSLFKAKLALKKVECELELLQNSKAKLESDLNKTLIEIKNAKKELRVLKTKHVSNPNITNPNKFPIVVIEEYHGVLEF